MHAHGLHRACHAWCFGHVGSLVGCKGLLWCTQFTECACARTSKSRSRTLPCDLVLVHTFAHWYHASQQLVACCFPCLEMLYVSFPSLMQHIMTMRCACTPHVAGCWAAACDQGVVRGTQGAAVHSNSIHHTQRSHLVRPAHKEEVPDTKHIPGAPASLSKVPCCSSASCSCYARQLVGMCSACAQHV